MKKFLLALPLLALPLASCGYSASYGYSGSSTGPVPTPSSSMCHYHHSHGEVLPDPNCTPGAIQSSDVMAICSPGWASEHREHFTREAREMAFAEYGVITTDPGSYGEYDHLIPLELGGANLKQNLWPEPGSIPNQKDAVENQLHADVCTGKVALSRAQAAIAHNWTTALAVTGG